MRNLLAKILLGLVFVLLALHLAIQNVTFKNEGSWSQPSFTLSIGKTNDHEPYEESNAPIESPPSMWDDLEAAETATTTSNHDVVAPTSSWGQNSNVTVKTTSFLEPSTSTSSATTSTPTTKEDSQKEEQADEEEKQEDSKDDKNEDSETQDDSHANHGEESKLPCSKLPGADDVVFIIKTGATEVEEKIPVHFNTTLRCYPNSLIFSDFGETFEGHSIHDALGNIVDQIRLNHEDFELWRRLHAKGRSALDSSELSINDHGTNLGGGGNPANGGWRLDKFKNIPMVNYTIHKYPDAKWFVYTDADTYIMWSNLLKWIQKMDSSRLTYLGSAAVIGEQVFGHGGSGYIISNALMHKAAEVYNEEQEEWDNFAEANWAGDCVLATLLEKLGAPLDWAFPQLQGGDNNVMDFWQTGYDRRIWCYPAVSYHHIPPLTISSLWRFEQEWIAKSNQRINHGDVYKNWYLPQLSNERDDWDNQSEMGVSKEGIDSSWQCRDACHDSSTCMQWSYDGAHCKLHQHTRLGKSSKGVVSGWMLERISAKVKQIDKCNEGDWILPDARPGENRRRRRFIG